MFLGFFCVSVLMKSLLWYVCVRVWECIHVWSTVSGGGVLGSPFDSSGGLTVQDWTIFIYNRAEENRFVPDDIFIDWNMYYPHPSPSHWKWLISGLVVAVLFLGGQGAMSTQHVGLKMNSLFLSVHGFFNFAPDWTEKKVKNGECVLFKKWPTRCDWKAKKVTGFLFIK